MREIFESDARAYALRIRGWRFADVAISPERWARLKYNFAQVAWRLRDQPCGVRDDDGNDLSWRLRFRQLFHEALTAYVHRCNAALNAGKTVSRGTAA